MRGSQAHKCFQCSRRVLGRRKPEIAEKRGSAATTKVHKMELVSNPCGLREGSGRAHHHAGQGRTGVARGKTMRHAAQGHQRQLYTPWLGHSSGTKTWLLKNRQTLQNWRRQQSVPTRSWSTLETRSRNDRRRLQKLRAELQRETASSQGLVGIGNSVKQGFPMNFRIHSVREWTHSSSTTVFVFPLLVVLGLFVCMLLTQSVHFSIYCLGHSTHTTTRCHTRTRTRTSFPPTSLASL